MLYGETSSQKTMNRFETFAVERLRIFTDQFQDPIQQAFPSASELKINYLYKKLTIVLVDILLSLDLIRDSILINDLKSLKRYLVAKRKWKKTAMRFESLADQM